MTQYSKEQLAHYRKQAAERAITNKIQELVEAQQVIIANARKLALRASLTSIDSAMSKSGIQYDKPTSKQVEWDRRRQEADRERVRAIMRELS